MLATLCTPALVYLAFSIAEVGAAALMGNYADALSTGFVALVITVLLNVLCARGLSVMAWVVVLVPFALMALITIMLLAAGGPFSRVAGN